MEGRRGAGELLIGTAHPAGDDRTAAKPAWGAGGGKVIRCDVIVEALMSLARATLAIVLP